MPRYQTYGQYDAKTDEFPDSAEKVLRANEEAASDDIYNDDGALNDGIGNNGEKHGVEEQTKTSTAERANKREGLYRGAVEAAVALNGAKGKSSGGSFMKTRVPIFAIIAIIGGMLVGVGFSQVMMPFHVIESLTEMTDGSFTARSARMPKLVRWMFNMEGETKYTTEIKGLFGSSTTRFRRSVNSERTKSRLAAEGVEVDTSGGNTVLKYRQADGTVRTVTADEYAAVYREDAEFRNKMNRGARSFLGRIAAHIDVTVANFLNSHNLTKNLFAGWINKVYDAEGQTARLHDVIEARKPTTAGNIDEQTAKTVGDESGTETVPGEQRKISAGQDADTLRRSYADMINDIAGITTSAVCGAAAVASAVTAAKLVIAFENARGAFSALAESVDKVKAGYGNESPINASANLMVQKDSNGLTMLQSEQMKWALSGGIYTPNKEAEDVKLFSTDAIMKSDLLGGISTSANMIMGCAIANIATAAVSLVANIATLGTFSVGKLAISIGVGVGASVAVSALTEMLVKNAKSDFCTEVAGPNSGACVYLGAVKYNGGNFQEGGGTPATKAKAEEFFDSYKVALADEAELVRETKNPFDTSSSHTFLGSIMSKLSLLAIEMPSLTSAASALTNLATASFSSLMPAASAVEKVSYFANQMRDDCENLKFGSIQAIGDASCEVLYITDQEASRALDPEEVFVFLNNNGSFKKDANGNILKQDKNGKSTDSADGVEIIEPDSMLGTFIAYCDYRSSPFGQIDQNIMTAESQTTDSTVLGGLLNAIPILGDILQIFEGEKQIVTIGWSSGANCVARGEAQDKKLEVVSLDSNGEATTSFTDINLESWDEFMKYAQSYVADDRYMQTSSQDYISPVQLFAEEQGLVVSDNELSFVDYLAKYTGYTPENMQIALNEVEYWAYIAQYEPEGKGPLVAPEAEDAIYDFSNPEVFEEYTYVAVRPEYVVYDETRNRTIMTA